MVNQWIIGKHNPSLKSLEKIAVATEKPLSYFFDSSENMQNVENHSVVVGRNANGKVIFNKTLEEYRAVLVGRLDKLEKNSEMLGLKLDLILEKLNNLKK